MSREIFLKREKNRRNKIGLSGEPVRRIQRKGLPLHLAIRGLGCVVCRGGASAPPVRFFRTTTLTFKPSSESQKKESQSNRAEDGLKHKECMPPIVDGGVFLVADERKDRHAV